MTDDMCVAQYLVLCQRADKTALFERDFCDNLKDETHFNDKRTIRENFAE